MYKIFKIAFFIAIIAGIIAAISMFANFGNLIEYINQNPSLENENPLAIIQKVYTPVFIISAIIASIAQLTYVVIGIVFSLQNPAISGGEKALWVIGFLIFNFITAIVFMVVNKKRNLVNFPRENTSGYPQAH